MKILHTADWHIGKILHKHSLNDEMSLFFEWLLTTIKVEEIDLLLISGDIFDLANPSIKDRKIYYQFLSQLNGLGIQVIITGGNHDSIGLLNAPAEILGELNIQVVGGATEDITEELILCKDLDGEPVLVVAAVPFLRDKDLRNINTDQHFNSREEALREGIRMHYLMLSQICEVEYPGLPVIASGHLFAKGATTSESERDIHIGNAAAIESSIFPSNFNYVALGHIHRPQIIGKNIYHRYSGSPIALSFSEKKDHKSVMIVEIIDGKVLEPIVKPIPKKRELIKFKGNFLAIKESLSTYKPTFDLPSLVELEIIEKEFSTKVLSEVEDLKEAYENQDKFKILKSRIQFTEGAKDTASLFQKGQNVEDLKPKDVFSKRLDIEEVEPEFKIQLLEAFQELLEEINQGE